MLILAQALLALVTTMPDKAPMLEQAAIFGAAGFARSGGQWKSGNCDGLESASYSSGSIDLFEDLNGDGRPEAVVNEGGAICYGNTGTRFWLLSKQGNGAWKLVHSEIGIPEFIGAKGTGGWPDIVIGGPGFCFPVLKWNGRNYRPNRFAYEGKPCRPSQ